MPNKSKRNTANSPIKPNKLLGQNFLRDKNILRKIVEAAQLSTGDRILEVGPGLGVLTEELAKRACPPTPDGVADGGRAGHIIAVEKDKQLAAQLKEKFINNKNVEIIENDILKINFSNLFCCHSDTAAAGEESRGIRQRAETRATNSPDSSSTAQNDNFINYKVVANIPYYLTSHLIRLLLEATNPPQDIILLIQKEVAQRICAKPPKMSLLAVSVQFYARPKIISYVSKNAFWPKPKVDSAIIKMTLHQQCHPRESGDPDSGFRLKARLAEAFGEAQAGMTKKEIKNFFTVARAGFAHPRKQLLNNLSAGLKISRTKTADLLQKTGLKPEQRAETLSINDWLKIAEALKI